MKKLSLAITLIFMLLASCSNRKTDVVWKTWSEKPPMGWNSFDAYYGCITESQFKQVVDTLAASFLPYGYEYAVLDYCWFNSGPKDWNPDQWISFDLDQRKDSTGQLFPRLAMDANGRLQPALNRFPSAANGVGLKALADYTHSKGLKFGLHIMRGIPRQAVIENTPISGTSYKAQDVADLLDTCRWLNNMYGVDIRKEGAQEYYNSLFNQYAERGVDLIKADDMMVNVYRKGEIEMMRKAIDQCGRPIVLSLSCGESPIPQANHLESQANMYRISNDFWDNWGDLRHNVDLLNRWNPFTGDGTWPDADMLPIGRLCLTGYPRSHNDSTSSSREHNSRFTDDEMYLLMNLWSIARSPLMWGGDPIKSDQKYKAFLQNNELIEVNQNSSNNHQVYMASVERTNSRVWIADVPGTKNDKYIAFFNLKDQADTIDFESWWEKLADKYEVRDLWKHESIGTVEKKISAELQPHASVIYKLTEVN